MNYDVDVAIIGGGPAGSTAGTLLKKYAPNLSVTILERERFPRDHVGESQLPAIGRVLNEMGVWDKVEAAGFPIKIGATYRWGTTDDLWDFNFVKETEISDKGRPGRYEGVRANTAFQVDRAIYDEILLNHARKMGCAVREETTVREVGREGDRIESLKLADGEEIRAKYVIDASGGAGVVRRAMGVETNSPSTLRNVAIWRYWQNAEWAVKIGVGGTRVYVMSLGYGWIWFIPLGPTRTSVGLVVPAEYYKSSGERPEALYERAMGEDPLIAGLLKNATPEGGVLATKDWSFIADRTVGENWFLAGESAGFADPILAAGMTLSHQDAREAAYTILALEMGKEDAAWLRQSYESNQRKRLWQHIRFADYWYSANAQFTDLKEFTRELAKDAGLDLDADAAFQWLGTGGFTTEALGLASLGSFDVRAVKLLTERLGDRMASWAINGNNRFVLDLDGAEEISVPEYKDGTTTRVRCYLRDGKKLPFHGVYKGVIRALKWGADWGSILKNIEVVRASSFAHLHPNVWRQICIQTLESMVVDGWVRAERDPAKPPIELVDEPLPVHQK
ncbi:NAD(P)/FAD-dependent oxidoreductase [bacterium]|nr:MAG: NAD(P)/FAD-dependent oxidoreductase [bacterium]